MGRVARVLRAARPRCRLRDVGAFLSSRLRRVRSDGGLGGARAERRAWGTGSTGSEAFPSRVLHTAVCFAELQRSRSNFELVFLSRNPPDSSKEICYGDLVTEIL